MNITSIILDGTDICVCDIVTCLGVLIDSELTFADYVTILASNCFFQLWQLCRVHCTLPFNTANVLVLTLTASCVDYCNSIVTAFAQLICIHLSQFSVCQLDSSWKSKSWTISEALCAAISMVTTAATYWVKTLLSGVRVSMWYCTVVR